MGEIYDDVELNIFSNHPLNSFKDLNILVSTHKMRKVVFSARMVPFVRNELDHVLMNGFIEGFVEVMFLGPRNHIFQNSFCSPFLRNLAFLNILVEYWHDMLMMGI